MDRDLAPDITRMECCPRVFTRDQGNISWVGDYPNFYLGSTTVAGALAGLLHRERGQPPDGSAPEQ
jgi:hypothetical protein